jgi:hypothetical protein
MDDKPTQTPGPGTSSSLIDRVKNILLTPKTEWDVIDREPATIQGIYTSYVIILAAIGPIAMLIGQQVFGWGMLGVTIKPPIGYSVATAAFTYALSLVGCYVSAMVIDALAPSFGGTKDLVKAFKVAAYSATASWIAGIFQIIPALGFLAILGLYSLYLLYLGLPKLMRVSADKAVGYTVVVIVVQIVIYFLIAMVVGALVNAFFPLSSFIGGTVRL